jgi:hypothetical protein
MTLKQSTSQLIDPHREKRTVENDPLYRRAVLQLVDGIVAYFRRQEAEALGEAVKGEADAPTR